MKNHSIIFIDQLDQHKYERLDGRRREVGLLENLKANFYIMPWDLPKRICTSFVPPVFGSVSRYVYVDFVGPLIAILSLWFLLNFGHSDKHPQAMLKTPPIITLAYYSMTMPSICLFLAKVGNSSLTISETVALLGYGLYGHVITIFICYLFSMESSNIFFFTIMIIFGGLSGLRLVIILLMTIPKPVARLLVCSVITTFHILFLIFIHYAYMHRTFIYGGNKVSHL